MHKTRKMPKSLAKLDRKACAKPTYSPYNRGCEYVFSSLRRAWAANKKETSDMVTVGMNYHVIVGKQQDFEEKFKAVVDALRAAPGHSLSTLWKDVNDDASYLITSEWSDEQAFSDFIRSDAFRAVTDWGKEQILSTRPQHKVYKH